MKYTGPEFEREVERIIRNALREDVGDGDHSSLACIPAAATGKARLLVKDEGVIAGIAFAKAVFRHVDPSLKIESLKKDGDIVVYGDEAFYVSGSSRSILTAERIVLNSMQRMSAIATKTRAFVDRLAGTKTKILDTRKTTPGLRLLEKWSVDIGGGVNHRYGLYDMIMLKDNHIDFAGGITNAINKTVNYLETHQKDLKIIVEARNMEEIHEILESSDKVYRILIDNFNYVDTKKAVDLINGRCLTESSGGITLDTVRNYADCGVDYVSSGALTHSVYNMDLSLKAMHE